MFLILIISLSMVGYASILTPIRKSSVNVKLYNPFIPTRITHKKAEWHSILNLYLEVYKEAFLLLILVLKTGLTYEFTFFFP